MSSTKEKKIVILSFITAFTLSIYILEMFIPKPLPFMKIGLSNVMIVYMLFSDLVSEALIVTLAKTVVGGFITGTLFNPTTLMSFSGGILAYIFMLFFMRSKIPFSVIGISIIGAVMHNIGQLLTVNLLLIKDQKILYLFPILLLLALVTGLFTGYAACLLLKHLNLRSLYERTDF